MQVVQQLLLAMILSFVNIREKYCSVSFAAGYYFSISNDYKLIFKKLSNSFKFSTDQKAI